MSRGAVDAYEGYEPVIGLEVHAQLATRTKLFCRCETSFGDPPNSHVCPVCLGLPGALPALNGAAVLLAVTAGLALGCAVQPRSVFARKNYFYPDLPKGYQISQFDEPLAVAGKLEVEAGLGPRAVGITRVHLEEDAGKNLHGVSGLSLVDFNRAGTPLIEIVSEPDLRAPAEAKAYLKQLREILLFAGVCDGDLERGNFRCDANVSVRRGGAPLGTRVELKNINSFRFVDQAIDGEIARQVRLLAGGQTVRRQTRGYDAGKRESYLLREKEAEDEYRYFPDPDLPPLSLDAAYLAEAAARLPEKPAQKRARWRAELGLSEAAAQVLSGHPRIALYFEEAALLSRRPVRVANFIQAELLRDVTTSGLDARFPITAKQLCEIVELVESGAISGKQAKQLYAAARGTDASPASLSQSLGLRVIADEATLAAIAAELCADHPKQAAQYRAGKTGVLGFFVGQLMERTGGSADPKLASEVVKKALEKAN